MTQERRRGPEHHWSGARLPTAPSLNKPDDIGDPADGQAVPRCLSCGTPKDLLAGRFIPDDPRRRRVLLRYRLCVHCLEHANGPLPPPDTDPLYVEAA